MKVEIKRAHKLPAGTGWLVGGYIHNEKGRTVWFSDADGNMKEAGKTVPSSFDDEEKIAIEKVIAKERVRIVVGHYPDDEEFYNK